jgi:HlyD family secretion protein
MMHWFQKHWRWLLALILIAMALMIYNRWRGKAVTVVHMEQGTLTQSVAATGRINTLMRTELSAEVTAKVLRVFVREGDHVEAGTLLVELDASQVNAALGQARAATAEAQAKLQQQAEIGAPQSKQNLIQARTTFEVAQREHARAQELVAKGFFSQQKLDETQKLLDSASSAYESAKLQAEANSPSGAEALMARSRLDQARAALTQAQALASKYRITAPYDAVVLSRNTEPGNMAQPGKTLLTLSAQVGTRIDVSIDEKNLHILQMGMPAKAATDAFPGRLFDAKLAYIAPGVDAQKGTVDVRLDIPSPPAFLRTDMTVSVELVGAQRKGIWLLPTDAVRDIDRPAPWVLLIRDGVATRAEVKLGLRSAGAVEISSGLTDDDKVIPVSEPSQAGERVYAGSVKAKAQGVDVPQGMFR